jgi:hypothetical protein
MTRASDLVHASAGTTIGRFYAHEILSTPMKRLIGAGKSSVGINSD